MSENARAAFDLDVLPMLEDARGEWIARTRAAARRIAAENGEVTINDVRAVCPPPEGADPRIMGAVFARGEFIRTGFAASERKSCHGRMIGVFRLRGGASARVGATKGT